VQLAWPHMMGDGTADAAIKNSSVCIRLDIGY
jgi:hypothetical protein